MCKIKGWNPGTVLVTFLLYGLGHYDQRQLLEENIKWGLAVSEGKSMAISDQDCGRGGQVRCWSRN